MNDLKKYVLKAKKCLVEDEMTIPAGSISLAIIVGAVLPFWLSVVIGIISAGVVILSADG